MKKDKYPDDWKEIANRVKEKTGYRCQACGRQCRKPGEPHTTHKNTLTVAHLNHDESDCRPENLMAMCAPCHVRYDARSKAEMKTTGKKTPDYDKDMERIRDGLKRDARKLIAIATAYTQFVRRHGKKDEYLRCFARQFAKISGADQGTAETYLIEYEKHENAEEENA